MEIEINTALDVVAGRIMQLRHIIDTHEADSPKALTAKIQLHEAEIIFDELKRKHGKEE